MTPEEAHYLRHGLNLTRAYLRDDDQLRERLTKPFLSDREFPRLADSFTYVGMTAVSFAAEAENLPFQEVLQRISPDESVIFFEGLGVAPWDTVIGLVSAAKRSNDEARTHTSMDVNSAINGTFRFGVSALQELTNIPPLAGMSPVDVVDVLLEALDQDEAVG